MQNCCTMLLSMSSLQKYYKLHLLHTGNSNPAYCVWQLVCYRTPVNCLLHSGCRTPLNCLSVHPAYRNSVSCKLYTELHKSRICSMPTLKLQKFHKLNPIHSGCRTPVDCLSVKPAYRNFVSCISYTEATLIPHMF